tara:strand:- start:118 stop:1188 length:1071 start_codon:yes stop_codon:yes gene_type:complete
MNFKKNLNNQFFINFLIISNLWSKGFWVKYGFEIFDYVIDAPSLALGSANVSYNTNSIPSSIINPIHSYKKTNFLSITHQSRFAGIVNSELLGFQIARKEKLINVNILYEGIGNIPDTQNMLLDWGYDGQFGTNDLGEGNGILDEGERLDLDNIRYFNQSRFGFYGAFRNVIYNMPVGFGLKILSHSLDDHHALGIGLDLGIEKKINSYNFGIVMRNIPSSGMIWDNGTIEGTLPSISLGLHAPLNISKIRNFQMDMMARFDAKLFNSHLDSQIRFHNMSYDLAIGFEGTYKERFKLRLGQDFLKNITGGVGLNWDNLIIDYSFSPANSNKSLGNNHLITINLSYRWILEAITNKS